MRIALCLDRVRCLFDPGAQVASACAPSAVFTLRSSSSMVTTLLALQSPMQAFYASAGAAMASASAASSPTASPPRGLNTVSTSASHP